MSNPQLYIAVGIPLIVILELAGFAVILFQMADIRRELDGIHREMDAFRNDLREVRSDIKLLTGKVYELRARE